MLDDFLLVSGSNWVVVVLWRHSCGWVETREQLLPHKTVLKLGSFCRGQRGSPAFEGRCQLPLLLWKAPELRLSCSYQWLLGTTWDSHSTGHCATFPWPSQYLLLSLQTPGLAPALLTTAVASSLLSPGCPVPAFHLSAVTEVSGITHVEESRFGHNSCSPGMQSWMMSPSRVWPATILHKQEKTSYLLKIANVGRGGQEA